MKRVMFVCKRNSRRSQMAEGFARQFSNDHTNDPIEVTSSGLEASQVDPLAIQVMQEVGIDINQQTSKALSDFDPERYDAVISLCGCGVNLPPEWVVREIFEDWQLDDPDGASIETFRQIRDQVKERVQALMQRLES